MENPQSVETAGYRCSSSADPSMITPEFPLAFRLEEKNRGNLLFVRCHRSMRSTTMIAAQRAIRTAVLRPIQGFRRIFSRSER